MTLPGHGLGAVRVFAAGGAERRDVGPIIDADPSMTAITRLDANDRLDVVADFQGKLREGDCVLFEPIYEPCDVVRGDTIDASMGLSSDSLGIAQGVWRVHEGQLTPIPDSERSCRDQSRLIHNGIP
jgi:hypothetical protein